MDDRVNFCFPVYTLSVHYKVNTISIMFDSSFIRFFHLNTLQIYLCSTCYFYFNLENSDFKKKIM